MTNTSKKVGSQWPDPPKQQPYSFGRSSSGRYTRVKYSSLSPSEIEALALTADSRGLNYDVSVGFGERADITIEYNFNQITAGGGIPSEAEEVKSTWEISRGKFTKNILESAGNALIIACAEVELNELKRRVRDNTLHQQAYFDTATGKLSRQTYLLGGVSTPFSDAAMQIYKMLLDGTDLVETFGATLTHNQIVTGYYSHPATFTNIGKIISSTTLIASESVPLTVLFNFPNDTNPAPVQIGDLGIYQTYYYGWFKNAPEVRELANNKWNIQQTWEYGLWLINKFGGTIL